MYKVTTTAQHRKSEPAARGCMSAAGEGHTYQSAMGASLETISSASGLISSGVVMYAEYQLSASLDKTDRSLVVDSKRQLPCVEPISRYKGKNCAY